MAATDNDSDLEGDDLWQEVMADVTPLPGRRKPAPKAPAGDLKTATRTAKPALPPQVKTQPKADPVIGSGLDASSKRKLVRGKMDIEDTLDLHAYTRDGAQVALTNFLITAQQGNKRCVLVITGHGKGILKAAFAEWIREKPLNRIVLESTAAQPQHGGNGAFYVLLRRLRMD